MFTSRCLGWGRGRHCIQFDQKGKKFDALLYQQLSIIELHDATAAVNTAADTTDDLLEWR